MDEITFLKDQVSRLNGQLSYYHELYLEKVEKQGSNPLSMILNNHTTPLLAEYDRVIYELTQELQSYKVTMIETERKIKSITNENERLWEEKVPDNYNSQHSGAEHVSDGELRNMQNQIDILKKEKTSLEELLKVSEGELERLQRTINDMNMKPDAVMFNDQLQSLKNQHRLNINDLENEITAIKEKERESRNELEKTKCDYLDQERDYRILVEKAKFDREANEENLSQLKMSLKRIEYLEEEKKHLQDQIEIMKKNLFDNDQGSGEWSAVLRGLETRCKDKDCQILDLNEKLSETQKALENVMSEKKEIEIRESQTNSECERLRGVIAGVVDDAGVRAREEVELMRQNYDKEVDRLVEELNYCEQNRQEKIAELEQMRRSKAQIEKEMELFYKAEKEKDVQEQSSSEMYHERCIQAEREREKMRLELENLKNSIDKENQSHKTKEENLMLEMNHLKSKLSQLQTSCDKAQLEADRFGDLLAAAEEAKVAEKKKYHETIRIGRHEYEMLKQSSRIKQQELETRLNALEETHRKHQDEMRQFLSKQQQITEKWRNEAHTLTNQYEDKISQMNKEIGRLKKREDELGSLLQQAKQKILEDEEAGHEKEKQIENLQNRILVFNGSNYGENTFDEDSQSWKLIQLKKQQQKSIKDTIAKKPKRSIVT